MCVLCVGGAVMLDDLFLGAAGFGVAQLYVCAVHCAPRATSAVLREMIYGVVGYCVIGDGALLGARARVGR